MVERDHQDDGLAYVHARASNTGRTKAFAATYRTVIYDMANNRSLTAPHVDACGAIGCSIFMTWRQRQLHFPFAVNKSPRCMWRFATCDLCIQMSQNAAVYNNRGATTCIKIGTMILFHSPLLFFFQIPFPVSLCQNTATPEPKWQIFSTPLIKRLYARGESYLAK